MNTSGELESPSTSEESMDHDVNSEHSEFNLKFKWLEDNRQCGQSSVRTIVSADNCQCGQLSGGHMSGRTFVQEKLFQNISCLVLLERS